MKALINFFIELFKKKDSFKDPRKNSQVLQEVVQNATPWMDTARGEIGTKEIPGSKHSPKIIEYHAETSLMAEADEVPWCSAFVCWVLAKAGFKHTRSARARSYLDYGTKLDKPVFGCIVIFDRGNGKGHVGFFVKENLASVTVLGGNQSNQVCYSEYAKTRVLGYCWPVKD